jgi:hypothetical protein
VSASLICYKLNWEERRSRKRTNHVLTQTEHWQISNSQLCPAADGTIEIEFKLPHDLPATSGSFDMKFNQLDLHTTFYAWHLNVESELKGVDLMRLYEVPVARYFK